MLKFRDGNPLNAQRANMLIVNLRGEPIKWWGSTRKSSFIGIKWDRFHGLWRAHFKDLTIGHYIGEIEAAEAYNDKVTQMFGNDAELIDLDIELVGK